MITCLVPPKRNGLYFATFLLVQAVWPVKKWSATSVDLWRPCWARQAMLHRWENLRDVLSTYHTLSWLLEKHRCSKGKQVRSHQTQPYPRVIKRSPGKSNFRRPPKYHTAQGPMKCKTYHWFMHDGFWYVLTCFDIIDLVSLFSIFHPSPCANHWRILRFHGGDSRMDLCWGNSAASLGRFGTPQWLWKSLGGKTRLGSPRMAS